MFSVANAPVLGDLFGKVIAECTFSEGYTVTTALDPVGPLGHRVRLWVKLGTPRDARRATARAGHHSRACFEDQVEGRLGRTAKPREACLLEHVHQACLAGLRTQYEFSSFGD